MKFDATYFGQSRNSWANQVLVEGHNNSQLLQVSLDDCFANQSSTEESPKWDQKVAARDASQIEQRVRNLQGENGILTISVKVVMWVTTHNIKSWRDLMDYQIPHYKSKSLLTSENKLNPLR